VQLNSEFFLNMLQDFSEAAAAIYICHGSTLSGRLAVAAALNFGAF
jgi:hypothetical protein